MLLFFFGGGVVFCFVFCCCCFVLFLFCFLVNVPATYNMYLREGSHRKMYLLPL